MQWSCFATLLPKSQGFYWWWWEGGWWLEANSRRACHREHARAPCLVKGTLQPHSRAQSTSPNIGQDVRSLEGLQNPEKACYLSPTTFAGCLNLPKCPPRSPSSILRTGCLVSLGVEGRETCWPFSQRSLTCVRPVSQLRVHIASGSGHAKSR